MESNAVKVRFFSKSGKQITHGLSERKFMYALPTRVRARSELKVGSLVAVTNHYGYIEPAVIVEFLVVKRTYDLKQVVGNYDSDYYGEMEDTE